ARRCGEITGKKTGKGKKIAITPREVPADETKYFIPQAKSREWTLPNPIPLGEPVDKMARRTVLTGGMRRKPVDPVRHGLVDGDTEPDCPFSLGKDDRWSSTTKAAGAGCSQQEGDCSRLLLLSVLARGVDCSNVDESCVLVTM
ncbi:hypothetical protein T310_10294, partial [Rasamsonia emersonii CBS 393.64]